ncbi:Cof-type HAD-IIB family hydrolase [Streptococcus suis]|uniref:Cof-type HAD-IIB family hydrolase n=1 Tax=Streptococcus suis TaxID=1307 RepID=UPI002A7C9F6F|nr:HAD family hydrolase [Streptococcus suis]HEM5173256.1 HAD family hydrolase [Streptococcus suis]HEM5202081.1 HAD family hydrolase [Streptococcus suis]HEM5220871.1 HAD family hydrolase [Streptococcus suis]HEM5223087.1 HAD family hydrolase [Streptococcus suis]
MTVRLIATDMDGTFLDGQGSFDRERFSRVLDQLDQKKIPFVIASGNGIGRLLQLFQGFEYRLIFVADNGAHVYQNGKTVIRRAIQQVEVEAILHFFKGRWADVCLMLSNEENIYMQVGAGMPFAGTGLPIKPEQMKAFQDRVVQLEDLAAYPTDQPIFKAGFWVPEEQVDELVGGFNRQYAGQLMAVTSGYGSVDILPQGIHKAWGLEQVLISLDIEPEQVMAFGDSDNDIELLSYVGYSYAMENATDKVKAVAKYMAPSHLEAGVLQVIEEYIL